VSFVKAGDVLKLALKLQATAEGVSLADIQRDFGVSRRTAERMRDAVEAATRQLEEVRHGGREKRWRLAPRSLERLADPTAEEIAGLARAAALARSSGVPLLADELDSLHHKLKASQRAAVRARNEPDIEALLAAEAFASRPGPKARFDAAIVDTLRQAIRRYRKLRIVYRYRGSGRRGWDVVHPYGFLIGHRHYLVALREQAGDFRSYALANFEGAEILPESFARRADFALADYAARSFGVFQEKPQDVIWRFGPEAAADAREFLFHPTQSVEERADGSLLVRFRAGGLKEMAWHLLTWGDQVDVLAPAALRRFWNTKSFAAAKRRLRPNSPL
jgi:predicted DNA-binding transcriptional regulator YafY